VSRPAARRAHGRAREEALRILAGCDRGATEAMLVLQGVDLATLERLVQAGEVRTWVQRLQTPRIDVRWYSRTQ